MINNTHAWSSAKIALLNHNITVMSDIGYVFFLQKYNVAIYMIACMVITNMKY